MQAPDSMEEMLSRLMPRALSEGGQRSIDEMLDELMGPAEEIAEPTEIAQSEKSSRKKWIPVGIAAGMAALAAISLDSFDQNSAAHPVVAMELQDTVPVGMVVVGEEDRVEGMTDEGWMSDPEGQTMQALRMRVVQENTIRDEETGLIFQLTEPRDEMVLIPVNSF